MERWQRDFVINERLPGAFPFWIRNTIKGTDKFKFGEYIGNDSGSHGVHRWFACGGSWLGFISGTSHLITGGLKSNQRWGEGLLGGNERAGCLPNGLTPLVLTRPWCPDSEEKPQERREWICHIHFSSFSWGWIYFSYFESSMWPRCDKVPFPWNHISIFISNKAHIWASVSHWFISLSWQSFALQTLCQRKRGCDAVQSDDGWQWRLRGPWGGRPACAGHGLTLVWITEKMNSEMLC